jgi:hypothetical protein
MLNLDILSKNKDIFNPNSQDQERNYGIWDLTRSSVSFKNTQVQFKKYVVVREDYQMRPDIIAFKVYGDLKYTGSLMKINSISNPFAVKEGDVIAAPIAKAIDASFNTKAATLKAGETNNNNPNTQFRKAQEQKKFKISNSRADFLAKRSMGKNPTAQILPPNMMQEGQRQTVRTNSVIGLGPDVSNASPNPNANI